MGLVERLRKTFDRVPFEEDCALQLLAAYAVGPGSTDWQTKAALFAKELNQNLELARTTQFTLSTLSKSVDQMQPTHPIFVNLPFEDFNRYSTVGPARPSVILHVIDARIESTPDRIQQLKTYFERKIQGEFKKNKIVVIANTPEVMINFVKIQSLLKATGCEFSMSDLNLPGAAQEVFFPIAEQVIADKQARHAERKAEKAKQEAAEMNKLAKTPGCSIS